jgi:hypothetical protein
MKNQKSFVKILVTGIIGLFILIILVVGYFFFILNKDNTFVCKEDSDCKLVYDSCSCVSVPKSVSDKDAEKRLKPDIMCFYNDCNQKNTKAVCKLGSCQKKGMVDI